jgi:hypothetical protein
MEIERTGQSGMPVECARRLSSAQKVVEQAGMLRIYNQHLTFHSHPTIAARTFPAPNPSLA